MFSMQKCFFECQNIKKGSTPSGVQFVGVSFLDVAAMLGEVEGEKGEMTGGSHGLQQATVAVVLVDIAVVPGIQLAQ